MPFKEKTRDYAMQVAGGKCQYYYYDEKRGWQQCDKPAQHVHHIIGEAETLQNGGDPERCMPLPLCEDHHVRNSGDTLGERDASFHPDISQAYGQYREWKQAEQHMAEIQGRKSIDYSSSPFADVAASHKEMAQHGERYISGDGGTDAFYEELIREKMVIYNAQNNTTRPQTSPHPSTDTAKKPKKWYDFLG